MTRNQFRENKIYAARCAEIVERPVENSLVTCLRLVFEIFAIETDTRKLCCLGKLACREVVIGSVVNATNDARLSAYADALGIPKENSHDVGSWLAVARRKPWVRIRFGPVSQSDDRNSFQEILPFSTSGFAILEWDYDLTKEWVRVSVAAEEFNVSHQTIRRRVQLLEPIFGDKLVRRTQGNQRRIRLPLLKRLWDGNGLV